MSPTSEASLGALLADVAHRLRPVCSTMPESEFVALVGRIVDLELKYRAREERELCSVRDRLAYALRRRP